jgi:hypothetical protein
LPGEGVEAVQNVALGLKGHHGIQHAVAYYDVKKAPEGEVFADFLNGDIRALVINLALDGTEELKADNVLSLLFEQVRLIPAPAAEVKNTFPVQVACLKHFPIGL